MNWEQICRDPILHNLPYKIELNQWGQIIKKSASPVAPEICVEVMSPGNSKAQMQYKGKLYFDAGAKEFRTCDKKGNIRFYNRDGKLKRSGLIPDFPKK